MTNPIKVLDHGYVRFVEAWGHGDAGEHTRTDYRAIRNDDECGIIEAARQSTQGSFRGWDRDERLLRFLYSHRHATPFEFAGMTLEVQAPILVFREWQRHRTQSYNEMSARYAPLPDLHYVPTTDRLMVGSGDGNRQAGTEEGSRPLTRDAADMWLDGLVNLTRAVEEHYRLGLSVGVPREVARCSMMLHRYSRMRASASLRNWLAFLTLRMNPAAQWEIRQYALAVAGLVRETFPRTWSLFEEVRS